MAQINTEKCALRLTKPHFWDIWLPPYSTSWFGDLIPTHPTHDKVITVMTSNIPTKVKGKGNCIAVMEHHMSQLRSVTCRMGSHSVTCYPTQVNAPRLHHSQSGRYLIYLPRRDGRLSWPRWLVTYRDGLPARRRPPIQVLTGPSVD